MNENKFIPIYSKSKNNRKFYYLNKPITFTECRNYLNEKNLTIKDYSTIIPFNNTFCPSFIRNLFIKYFILFKIVKVEVETKSDNINDIEKK